MTRTRRPSGAKVMSQYSAITRAGIAHTGGEVEVPLFSDQSSPVVVDRDRDGDARRFAHPERIALRHDLHVERVLAPPHLDLGHAELVGGPRQIHERTPVLLGSRREVEQVLSHLDASC